MAGDSSSGMNFAMQSLVAIEVFHAGNGLPETTRARLARLVREDGIRFVASNAETGSKKPVVGRAVDGGPVLDGVKTFNTNSGGADWVNVGFRLESAVAGHHALVPPDADGVTCRHDWDVMGQRGTHGPDDRVQPSVRPRRLPVRPLLAERPDVLNARPTDAKEVWIGDYYLNGTEPPLSAMLRV